MCIYLLWEIGSLSFTIIETEKSPDTLSAICKLEIQAGKLVVLFQSEPRSPRTQGADGTNPSPVGGVD